MEQTRVNLTGLRTKLAVLGRTQHDLARAAHLPDSALSSILNGKEYLGPKRATRLMDALHQLALEAEAKKQAEASGEQAAEEQPKPKPEPRIRRL